MQNEQKVFELHSEYAPTGDQPQAIEALVKGFQEGNQFQTLLGVTGSGKTFTMANVIQQLNKPTLVIAHNKTLSSKSFFQIMQWNILSPTMIITSRRHMSLPLTHILKKTRPLMTRSISCATRPQRRFQREMM